MFGITAIYDGTRLNKHIADGQEEFIDAGGQAGAAYRSASDLSEQGDESSLVVITRPSGSAVFNDFVKYGGYP